MMAAIAAAKNGADVTLLEKNEKLGKKLYITGKGRCNVTNACDREDFFDHVVSNPRFLYSAYAKWNNWDMEAFLEDEGLALKTERGNRVFPVSDKSSDVIRTLQRAMERAGVKYSLYTEVESLWLSGEIPRCLGVQLRDGSRIEADAVIVATGGLSYPSTGSDGAGYRFARSAGHTQTECIPSLVPFDAVFEDGSSCKELQGLSLKNVGMQVLENGKKLTGDFGEMLFTHFGVSGPLVLTASSQITARLNRNSAGKTVHPERPHPEAAHPERNHPEGAHPEAAHPEGAHPELNHPERKHPGNSHLRILIDLKPALTEEQLDRRFLRELEAGPNKQMKNLLVSLYPSRLVPVVLRLAGVSPEKCGREITKEERQRLVATTKALPLRILRTRDFKEAIITQGGISVKEIRPATMESRIVKGLYFAGEVLDVDAYTGGYNLQIAWSTGYTAGCAAASLEERK